MNIFENKTFLGYPKNRTQLFNFLRQNPGIFFRITWENKISEMRRLERVQTNAFSGLNDKGEESWFGHEKGNEYTFEGSKFTVIKSFCRYTYDFDPSEEEIRSFCFNALKNAT